MFNHTKVLKECKFKTSRSSGAGGQHVNKIETRVTIVFDVENTLEFSVEQIETIKSKLAQKIDSSGKIQISSQKFKSQIKNKIDTKIKLITLLENALIIEKARKKTKISKASKIKRLNDKKNQANIKKSRKKPKIQDD